MTKERTTDKFHALQLFTDTFSAETVHLTNEAIGIYIRLLCFAWTKNTKPFKEIDAMRICQCRTKDCELRVMEVLSEFFIVDKKGEDFIFTHKRLIREYDYLKNKYLKKSISGSIGAEIRWNKSANGKSIAPSPIPSPIPNSSKGYSEDFQKLWKLLRIKRGSKYRAYQIYNKSHNELPNITETSEIYNKQMEGVEDKFVPHFATWLSQKRWEIEESDQKQPSMPNLREKMEKLGYIFRHTEDHFDYFKKDGKEFKIDRYDKEHIIQNVE
tara:strand:- start:2884 stop:3693 length:810 start_codon:yes stop_codon:yes gene_type:complete